MKQTNERLCALAQKGDAAALDSLIDNNKSFIGKVANDLFRSMNLAQAGLNLDTDDLKQAGNLGLWKAVPKFDAARGNHFPYRCSMNDDPILCRLSKIRINAISLA